jgi:ABC-type branched-subunit amino acid transport system substrate-binding protein
VQRNARRRLRVGACLSLTGRFSRFGRQAAHALEVWASLDEEAQVLIEDDGSEVHRLEEILPSVAARSDLLLGPYSTVLMRAAGDMAAAEGWLIWNHGGSGDDVETAHPGHVASVLTPTGRYAEPFIGHLAARGGSLPELRIGHGKGKFGRQVVSGAAAYARRLGFDLVSTGPADTLLSEKTRADWVLITAGTFEEDIATLAYARSIVKPPLLACAVAAGVDEFSEAIGNPEGVFGIAQWFPGKGEQPRLGPAEAVFIEAYKSATGESPGYPAVQAFAGAVLAAHCARQADGTECELLWRAAADLDTSTLYGPFRIDRASGMQTAHQTVLVQWIGGTRTLI